MESPALLALEQKIASVARITPEGFRLLLSRGRRRPLARGENVLAEGQVARHIYFVESGYLRCFYNKDGKEINLQFALDGSFTTNLKSLRTGAPSDYTIQAGEPTVLWELAKDELLQLYAQSPEIESFGRRLVEHKLIQEEEHGNLFKLRTPLERYHYLAQHQPELLQRVSLSQLASYLGIARETLSRLRKPR